MLPDRLDPPGPEDLLGYDPCAVHDDLWSDLDQLYENSQLHQLDPLTLTLKIGESIRWDAARRAIEAVSFADLDYISFALGVTPAEFNGPAGALDVARETLHAALDTLAEAVTDVGQLEIVPGEDGSVLLRAQPGENGDVSAVYQALLDLSLMYVTEAAGLRPAAPLDLYDSGLAEFVDPEPRSFI